MARRTRQAKKRARRAAASAGPEETLTLCFKSRRLATKSLREIPREDWARALQQARCGEFLSECESAPVAAPGKDKDKRGRQSRGLTAYLFSESSLFVGDASLVLKSCGAAAPLAALEQILDLVAPSWRGREAKDYLKYATFQRLDQGARGQTAWAHQVELLRKHFAGESVVLGSRATSVQHLYVANYLPKDEMVDVCSTRAALSRLDPTESLALCAVGEEGETEDAEELAGGCLLHDAWTSLHGDEARSLAAHPQVDEMIFEPGGYSANGVFGKHFTTLYVMPQESCSYLSVETTAPLNRDVRHRFVLGAEAMCRAKTLTVCEFALCSALFSGVAPAVPGFKAVCSTSTVRSTFACAHHHFERVSTEASWETGVGESTSASWENDVDLYGCATPMGLEMEILREVGGAEISRPFDASSAASAASADVAPASKSQAVQQKVHRVETSDASLAHVSAAEAFLGAGHSFGVPQKDLPMSLLDVSQLRRQADLWHEQLPRVEPFYAVKCNSHPEVLAALWGIWQERGLGGFDAASPFEMQSVIDLGADPAAKVIYAHPCKQASAVTWARGSGVRRTTFDTSAELLKLRELWPEAELVLRMQTDDSLAQCPLSNKFGCAPEDCAELLAQAKALGMKVVGVSFHVGSGCSQVGAFRSALKRARRAFDEAEQQGFAPKLLDIGGGFPGWDEEGHASFADHAADIREMLQELFPSPEIQVIAEPGRFFAAKASSVLTTVVCVKEGSSGSRYYLNDGVYGSFNCLIFDHAELPRPRILRAGRAISEEEAGACQACTIFGPTCDGFDKLSETMALPQLRVGDRLLFENFGAYTAAASTCFNGFEPAASFIFSGVIR